MLEIHSFLLWKSLSFDLFLSLVFFLPQWPHFSVCFTQSLKILFQEVSKCKSSFVFLFTFFFLISTLYTNISFFKYTHYHHYSYFCSYQGLLNMEKTDSLPYRLLFSNDWVTEKKGGNIYIFSNYYRALYLDTSFAILSLRLFTFSN